MAKVLCVLYDDPVGGYPASYARDGVPTIDRYPSGQMLPTPKASADKMGRPRTNDRGDLQAAVLLPTLAASSGGDGLRWGPTPMEPMIGSLNPDWCERLMGYPSGWTALGGDPDGKKARPELREALKTALHACDASETP